ncbi:RHS repeat-associated core domain-containing protein [Blastococcus montanus]|uniref:RHS repeat-associated core domain-containing protein n=1 Tax=Blastococcus montanus TaxID=3144973 RepID=UPI003209D556
MTGRLSTGGYDGQLSTYTYTYTYAGSDQRELISQQLSSGSTYGYTYRRTDRNDQPLLEAISNSHGQSYLVHDDAGTPLALKAHTGNYVYDVLDGLGSPIGLINSRGVLASSYSYDPYGQVTEANLTGNAVTALNPYRFAGGMYDRAAPAFVTFRMRWYDTATGRFTQQDSIETLADPSRSNRYKYANGNPVMLLLSSSRFRRFPRRRRIALSIAVASIGVASGIAFLASSA